MYQNCGEVDFARYGSVAPDSEIAVEIRNGKGRVIANGGDLCLGSDNEEQSRSVAITIATSSAASAYYCRRVRPSSDNSVWDCNESKSLSSGSEGQFGRVPNSDDTRALLIYHSLSNGRYELEVSAEGGTEGDSPWTSVSVPVSFVVKDCSSTTTTSSTTTSTSTTRRSSPTCGDRDPSQDGNQRYPCPEGWSYKSSANSLTSPSRTRCCTPPAAATCGDTNPSKSGSQQFSCTGALVYKSSASKSRNPSESVCCECRSGYEGRSPNCRCPAGKEEDNGQCVDAPQLQRAATCLDTEPSQNGNQKFSCTGGYSYKTSSNSLTNPSRARCCAPPATCLDTEPSQNGNQKFSCTGGYSYKTSSNSLTNPSRARCCAPPATCLDTKPSQNGNQKFSCRGGYSYKTSSNSLTNPSRSRCCRPPAAATCSDINPSKSGPQQFVCTGALVYKSSASKSRNPSESVCCQCRSGYQGTPPNCRCPTGQVSVGNRCVARTCLDTEPSQNGNQKFSCTGGYSYKTSSNSLTSPSRDRCCNPPAATCADREPLRDGNQKFSCPRGWSEKPSLSAITSPSRDRCCNPPAAATCADREPLRDGNQKFSCPRGWSEKSSLSGITSPSRDRCCNPPAATCADREPLRDGNQRFSCTGSSVYNKSSARKTSPSVSVCCQCRSGYEGTPPNCRCPDGKKEENGQCVNEQLQRVVGTCADGDPLENGPQKYRCPSGWSEKSSLSAIKSPSRDRCCTPPAATCGDREPLRDGNQKFSCPSGWSEKSSLSGITSPSRDRCCTPPAATCGDEEPLRDGNQKFSCPSGYSYKTDSDSVTSPSRDRCCVSSRTCRDYPCLGGDAFRHPDRADDATNYSQSYCCIGTVSCSHATNGCSSKLCSGRSQPTSKYSQLSYSASCETCCEPCTTRTCGDTECETPGNQRFDCSRWSGRVFDSSKSASTDVSPSNCCKCGSGYEKVGSTCLPVCRADQERNLRNQQCECPDGKEEVSGRCVPDCRGDQERNSRGSCVCPSDQIEKGGQCVPPGSPTCEDTEGDGSNTWYDCQRHGLENEPGNAKSTHPNPANCCRPPRTCLSPSRFEPRWCGSGRILKNPLPNTGPRTKENCCRPTPLTCADTSSQPGSQPYDCGCAIGIGLKCPGTASYTLKSNPSSITSISKSNCCNPPPAYKLCKCQSTPRCDEGNQGPCDMVGKIGWFTKKLTEPDPTWRDCVAIGIAASPRCSVQRIK